MCSTRRSDLRVLPQHARRRAHEFGEHDGQPYFAMKYLAGGSLASGGRRPPEVAARLLADIARAVGHAHRRGILHRDLKPANILLDDDGRPHVADFGLSRPLDGSALTAPGAVVGTPSYMAPEQAASAKVIGVPADVYALGAVFYELLAGRPPFRGETALETLGDVLYRPAEPPSIHTPEVPRDLDTICLKCLDKEPSRRYGSALDLAEDLDRWRGGSAIAARPLGPVARTLRWVRRRPVVAAAAALALVLLALMGVLTATFVRQLKRERQMNALLQVHAAQIREESRQRRYAEQIDLARRAWEAGQEGAAHEWLDRLTGLASGPSDVRGFEWHYLRTPRANAVRTLLGHTEPVRAVAFSPDGRRVASGGDDDTVRVWDAATGAELLRIEAKLGGVTGLGWRGDGRALLATGPKTPFRVWDATTGQVGGEAEDAGAALMGAVCSANARRIAARRSDGPLVVWDGLTGKILQRIDAAREEMSTLAFSPDGAFLAVAGSRPGLRIYDAATGRLLSTARCGSVRTTAFDAKGRHVAVVLADGSAIVDAMGSPLDGPPLFDLLRPATSVLFNEDGSRLLVATPDGTLRLWGVEGRQELLTWEGHKGSVRAAAFRADGRRVVSGGDDGTVRLWGPP